MLWIWRLFPHSSGTVPRGNNLVSGEKKAYWYWLQLMSSWMCHLQCLQPSLWHPHSWANPENWLNLGWTSCFAGCQTDLALCLHPKEWQIGKVKNYFFFKLWLWSYNWGSIVYKGEFLRIVGCTFSNFDTPAGCLYKLDGPSPGGGECCWSKWTNFSSYFF